MILDHLKFLETKILPEIIVIKGLLSRKNYLLWKHLWIFTKYIFLIFQHFVTEWEENGYDQKESRAWLLKYYCCLYWWEHKVVVNHNTVAKTVIVYIVPKEVY